jgi:cobalt-zinc-cadmium efflux system outer membrane protein
MRLVFVLIFLIANSISIPSLYAQDAPTDTLRLTLKEAEDQFLKNNLYLIIQHYNIDNAQAQIITARLFQNPQLNYNIGAYNQVTKKLFSLNSSDKDIAQNGEYSVGISQLFLTAGKRNKNIELAN